LGLRGFAQQCLNSFDTETGAASSCYPSNEHFSLVRDTPRSAQNRYSDPALDITPLGLLVCLPPGGGTDSHRQYLDQLLTELQLQAKAYHRRPIAYMLWRNIVGQLNAAEITELMYLASRHLRLNHNQQREYGAELGIEHITPETLALLKGLGFNKLQCRFNLTPTESRQLLQRSENGELAGIATLLEDYGFNLLTAQVHFGHRSQDFHQLRKLLDAVLSLRPARIRLVSLDDLMPRPQPPSLATERQSSNQFLMLYKAIRNAGFRVIGNDCFMRPGDQLAIAQNQGRLRRTLLGYNACNVGDILGLGPDACSQLGSNYYKNHDPSQYWPGLQKQGSGRALECSLNEVQLHLRRVLDQLLCYHNLDMGYLENRYHFDFDATFGGSLPQLLPQTEEAWVGWQGHTLQLTKEGIIHLRAICQRLINRATLKT